MKYRMYGRDGVSAREFSKLVEWGIIKKIDQDLVKKVQVRRRVVKERWNSSGRLSYYSSEASGSGMSAFTYVTENEYENN